MEDSLLKNDLFNLIISLPQKVSILYRQTVNHY